MGSGTRALEIRRRQKRRAKRKKRQRKAMVEALRRGRTHPDRVKIAEEFWNQVRS